MNINDLPPNALVLTIRSEPYEVECDNPECRNGKCIIVAHPDDPLDDCPACHGTGKRRVRLVGWVEVEPDSEYETTQIEYCVQVYQQEPEFKGFYVEGSIEEIITNLVSAYRAKTLPPEIAENLEEVDEKTEP